MPLTSVFSGAFVDVLLAECTPLAVSNNPATAYVKVFPIFLVVNSAGSMEGGGFCVQCRRRKSFRAWWRHNGLLKRMRSCNLESAMDHGPRSTT